MPGLQLCEQEVGVYLKVAKKTFWISDLFKLMTDFTEPGMFPI
jgi:hypothetical protein